jgi:hypothetical protein
MPKPTKARSAHSTAAPRVKASQTVASDRKGHKANPASKQSRVIALLQSPTASRPYERTPIMVTTNLAFGEWPRCSPTPR